MCQLVQAIKTPTPCDCKEPVVQKMEVLIELTIIRRTYLVVESE